MQASEEEWLTCGFFFAPKTGLCIDFWGISNDLIIGIDALIYIELQILFINLNVKNYEEII